MQDANEVTVASLVTYMASLLEGTNVTAYGCQYLRSKLIEHYSDTVIFSSTTNKKITVSLKPHASSILKKFYAHHRKVDAKQDKKTILETAAKLLKADIDSMENNKSYYPSARDLSSIQLNNEFIPDSLMSTLSNVISAKDSKLKIAAIGQANVPAIRPRNLIVPLQTGHGIQLHHQFASKFLIETLHAMGFCCSYSEVLKFEQSATVSNGHRNPEVEELAGKSIQFSADKVDHNIATVDGNGTFHGIGIIAAVTPQLKISKRVPRLSTSVEEI